LEKAQNPKASYFPQAGGPKGPSTFYAHEFTVLSSLLKTHKPGAGFVGFEQ
jgi:hypothetical protein